MLNNKTLIVCFPCFILVYIPALCNLTKGVTELYINSYRIANQQSIINYTSTLKPYICYSNN